MSSSSSVSSPSALKATLIVALDSSNGIGKNGTLPWKLSKEMKYFRQATTFVPEDDFKGKGKQNAVIMGRTTWEGIPSKFRPLKDRINVVLSSKSAQELQLPEQAHQASSLQEAISKLSSSTSREDLHRIYIIGGAQLYKTSLSAEGASIADRILLTRITKGDDKWECDTFFPELDMEQWRKSNVKEHQEWLQGVEVPDGEITEGDVSWRYEMWVRK